MLRSLSLRLGWSHQRTHSHRTLSPLDLPEILVIIFSHLTDETLRYSVAPVCRLWLQAVQNVLVREVIWYSEWDSAQLSRVLSNLPGAERLVCHYPFTKYAVELLLVDALRKLETEYQQQRASQSDGENAAGQGQGQGSKRSPKQQQPPYRLLFQKHVPLQHLELVTTKFSSTPLDRFPFLSSLTTINLTLTRGYAADFSLTRILTVCPLLVAFHAKLQSTSIITVHMEPFERGSEQEEHPRPLALRSLILQGLHLDFARIKNLFSLTPRLKELKLIDMAMGWPYIWTPLFTYLQTLPIKLESTHFSYNNRTTQQREIDTLRTLQPRVPEWSLWGLDVQTSLLQSLEQSSNIVTKLELHWSHRPQSYNSACHGPDVLFAPDLIHKFLCNSPHLVHVKIIKSAFSIRNMDLFGRRTFGDLTTEKGTVASYLDPDTGFKPASGHPGIWQCRNLKTLQFEINAHLDVVPLSDPVQSRILFGYISRVCPNLEDLHISWPSICVYNNRISYTPRLSLQLDGGICLLARLKSLRRLKIDEYYLCQGPNCEVYELNWMVVSGRDFWSRRKRQEVMSNWRAKEAEEHRLDSERKKRGGLKKLEPVSQKKEDVAIAKELQDLGLLADVKNAVKEMDSNGNGSFACLERLSFEYPFDNRPRNELHRLFPKASSITGS
ncbi:hypothetical protein BGW39_000406 [Mortierella sp. 14UC]|nr:hypothetical protein BGW39_000406 [Mortierella sp. 14UC]